MMKKLVLFTFMSAVITASSVYANEKLYVEMDGGVDKYLLDDASAYAQLRLGVGAQLFKSECTGSFFGAEAHVGTNLSGISLDSDWFHDSGVATESPFAHYTFDASAVWGFETQKHYDIGLKLGARCSL